MKVHYELLHRPRHDDSSAETVGLFSTLAAARQRTGLAGDGDWEPLPHGGGWWLAAHRRDELGRQMLWMIVEVDVAETDAERIELALLVALEDGQVDGDHHKAWVIDRIVRALTGDRYEREIADYCAGEDGPDTYSWNEGIAP